MSSILFVGMNFYDYEEAIKQRMESRGNTVTHCVDKESFLLNHFPFLPAAIGNLEIKHHQKRILREIKGKTFDYVFVIVGRNLTPLFLETLKRNNPNARFILYSWDDVKRVQNFHRVKKYYDSIYTFDPQDAKNYGISFLPLFYCDRYDRKKAESIEQLTYDIYSVMNCHSDRERIAAKIISSDKNRRVKIILTDNGKSMIKRRLKGWRRNQNDNGLEFRFRKRVVPREELYDTMLRSKAILDVQFPSQIGLTMRTFDTLSVGRKIITTNESIRYYNFYDEANVLVIDRNNPEIPDSFLDSPYKSPPDQIIDSYSLENWIDVLFYGKSQKYLIESNPYSI